MPLEYYIVCEDCKELFELGKENRDTCYRVHEFCKHHHGHSIKHISEMNIEPYEDYKVTYEDDL